MKSGRRDGAAPMRICPGDTCVARGICMAVKRMPSPIIPGGGFAGLCLQHILHNGQSGFHVAAVYMSVADKAHGHGAHGGDEHVPSAQGVHNWSAFMPVPDTSKMTMLL